MGPLFVETTSVGCLTSPLSLELCIQWGSVIRLHVGVSTRITCTPLGILDFGEPIDVQQCNLCYLFVFARLRTRLR